MRFFYFSILSLFWFLARGQGQPNVIVIFVDDMGYGDLSTYGHPTIKTPNLDKMAEEGMLFTQFYASASVCTPSRAGLLTGRYPVRTGMVKGKIPGRVLFPNSKYGLPQNEVTIAEIVKQRGYATSMVGKWHLGDAKPFLPTTQGFDQYYGIPYSNDMDFVSDKEKDTSYWNVPILLDDTIIERPAVQETLTKRYTEQSIAFIKQKREEPFFLYLAHSMPHIPLFASQKFRGTSLAGLYGDVIEEIDWSVGQILQTLKDENLSENTFVIFTSDNGPWLVQKQHGGSAGLLKDGKGTTWEGGMRVPCIAWWPGTIPAGSRNAHLSTNMDILPTVAAIAGGSADVPIDGVSMLGTLKDPDESVRDFFAYYRNDEIYAVRYRQWKAHYITQTEYPAGPKQFHHPPLLYNLEIDPSERFDVSKDNLEILDIIEKWKVEHMQTVETYSLPQIEAEELIGQITVTGGKIRKQGMGNFSGQWGNDQQLWWVEASPGDKASIPLQVEEKGSYELYGYFTQAGDYGIIRLLINGDQVGAYVDGYSSSVKPTGPVSFGVMDLEKGKNEIVIELVGKDFRSAGYSEGQLVGIDGFSIVKKD